MGYLYSVSVIRFEVIIESNGPLKKKKKKYPDNSLLLRQDLFFFFYSEKLNPAHTQYGCHLSCEVNVIFVAIERFVLLIIATEESS